VFGKRRVVIEDFFAENLNDPRVLEIASKVEYKFDPKLPKGLNCPGIVEVETKSGKTFSRREDIPHGHPDNPTSDEELIAKFKDCARYNKKTMSEQKVADLVKLILEIENVADMKEITQILA
jgi:2-methylcitrate dehydratase PrpD